MKYPSLPFAAAVAVALGCSSSSPASNVGTSLEAGAPLEGGLVPDASPAADAALDDGGSLDASPGDDDSGFTEATHAPFPQIPNQGGPILASPKLVTITFAGYSEDATANAFGDWIVTSKWLNVVGHDYGVGAGTHVKHVVLPGPAPATASDLDTQATLQEYLSSGVLPSAGLDGGATDGGAGEYLYVLFYPASTSTTSFLNGPTSCAFEGGTSFIGGYHWETESGPYHVPYAVIPTCSNGALVEGATDLETSASHEFIEAATDPFPETKPAYALSDPYNPWTSTAGEVADLCEGQVAEESGFAPQRVWSNVAATGNGAPCVPASSDAFYGVSPSPSRTQDVAAGGSTTFTLTGFSTEPLTPWSLRVVRGESNFAPTLHLDTMSMNNGQTAKLTVTVPSGTPSGSFAGVFVTSYRSDADFNYWPVAVTVP